MNSHEKQASAETYFHLAIITIVISAFIACGGDSGNNTSDEVLSERNSASRDSVNYSGLTYKTYEGLVAEQPCDLALNKTVAHVSSTNQDYLCGQAPSTGIWSWVPYQGGNGTTVDENGQVYETFVDSRDGHIYKMVTIGSQTWMAENLAFATDSSHCMLDDGVVEYCGYGRYYRWSDAIDTAGRFSTDGVGCGYGSYAKDCAAIWSKNSIRGVCPQGWHLPDTSEWRTLFDFVGMPSALLKQGLSSSYLDNGTDVYGFSAFPMGYWYQGRCSNCSKSLGGSSLISTVMYLASTPIYHYDNMTLMDIPNVEWDEDKFNITWSTYFTKNGLLPVRCVKNIEENIYSSSSQYSNSETAFSSSTASTSSLYLAHSVPNSCNGKISWHGPNKMYRVDTKHDAQLGQSKCSTSFSAGCWNSYNDSENGGSSFVTWPTTVVKYPYGHGAGITEGFYTDEYDYSPLIDYCGGICGTYTLGLNEGNLGGRGSPFVGIGFSITGAVGIDITGKSSADVSDWGGICVTYVSDIDLSIQEQHEDYSCLEVILPKASTPTTKKISWNSFKPTLYAPNQTLTGEEAAQKLRGIMIEIRGNVGSSGNFNIISIGSYN